MVDSRLYEFTGDKIGGFRSFHFPLPPSAAIFIGAPEHPAPNGEMPDRAVRGFYPSNITPAHCYVSFSERSFDFGELSPYDLNYESDIYPGELGSYETRSVWAGTSRKKPCVSPPEWNDSRGPYRVRQSNPSFGDTFYLEFCPIPDADVDPERAAKAAEFWHAVDNPPPPCTPDRVTERIDQLAEVVPASMSRTPNPDAPGPVSSKYPGALEAYFAAMDRNGLDQIWNLIPGFSPVPRAEAITTRKEFTALEKQLGGRVPRFPGNLPWASGLFPIAYRDGWGLAVDVASKTPGAVWQFWPPQTMICVYDSLCAMLDELITAYRDGTTFGTLDVLHTNPDGTVEWTLAHPVNDGLKVTPFRRLKSDPPSC